LTIHRSQSDTFTIEIGNDGLGRDNYVVKGPGTSAPFTLKYMDGATNVTTAVANGNYSFNLNAGATKTLTLQVTVGSGATVGAVKSFLVTVRSTGAGTTKDAVKATVKVS